jgi:hypothetical protein
MAENQNKKYNIDKTLTLRKSGQGEKVYSHSGGKTHALSKKPLSKEKALHQIRDITESEIESRESHGHHVGNKQQSKNKEAHNPWH